MKDFLTEDTLPNNLKYSCISIVGNDFPQKCDTTSLIIRGGFSTFEEANLHIQNLSKNDNKYNIFIGQNGFWLPICNNSDFSSEKQVEVLNKQMETIIKDKIRNNLEYENRTNQLKENIKKENEIIKKQNEKLNSKSVDDCEESEEVKECEECEDREQLEEVKECEDIKQLEKVKEPEVSEELLKKLKESDFADNSSDTYDMLKNDEPIIGQNYCCISFITPHNSDDIYGLKIRGIFDKLDDANEYAEKLQKIDIYCNIFVAEINKWLEWDPLPEKIKNQKYENEMLNNIFDKKNQNNENLNIFNAELEKDKLEDELKKELEDNENTQNKIINSIFD